MSLIRRVEGLKSKDRVPERRGLSASRLKHGCPQLPASCLWDSNSRPGQQHQRSPGLPALRADLNAAQHTHKPVPKNEPPVYTLTHILTHTHTHILTHTYTHSNILTHTHLHTHAHVHTHSHTYLYIYIHTLTHSHTHIHTLTHTCACTLTRTLTYTHSHTCSHTHSLTHTHTHTDSSHELSPSLCYGSTQDLCFLSDELRVLLHYSI